LPELKQVPRVVLGTPQAPAGVEFIDENDDGPRVRLRKPPKQKR
jgi:hypothetical protein